MTHWSRITYRRIAISSFPKAVFVASVIGLVFLCRGSVLTVITL
jgi:hypothetical protein